MEKRKRSFEMRELSWDYTNLCFEWDRAFGFSWPQRSYWCSFCKKEFMSAQALGGHMNVHRKDRARMKLISSPCHSSKVPNPNPKSPFSLSAPTFSHFLPNSRLPSHQDKAPTAVYLLQHDGLDGGGDVGKKSKGQPVEVSGFARRVCKENGILRLDSELGLFKDGKEDLDLELKLGYS